MRPRSQALSDTPNDLGAGMSAGAGFVVGVTTCSFTRSQLEAEPHTHILGSVAAVPMLLWGRAVRACVAQPCRAERQ